MITFEGIVDKSFQYDSAQCSIGRQRRGCQSAEPARRVASLRDGLAERQPPQVDGSDVDPVERPGHDQAFQHFIKGRGGVAPLARGGAGSISRSSSGRRSSRRRRRRAADARDPPLPARRRPHRRGPGLGRRAGVSPVATDLPATTPLRVLVRLAHQRWAIEQQFKDEIGLDHLSLPGWQRHVALTALAYSFLQLERRRRGHTHLTLPRVRAIIRHGAFLHHAATLSEMDAQAQRCQAANLTK